jgi:hypothetical protein
MAKETHDSSRGSRADIVRVGAGGGNRTLMGLRLRCLEV